MWKRTLLLISLCTLTACDDPTTPEVSPSAQPSAVAVLSAVRKPTDLDSFMNSLMGNEAKTWQVVKRLEGTVDMSQECYLDDQIRFTRSNHKIELLTGSSLCRTEMAATKDRQGGWQITTELNIYISLNQELPYQLKVNALNDREMELAYFSDAGKHVTETYVAIDTGPGSKASAAPARPVPAATSSPKPTRGLFPF